MLVEMCEPESKKMKMTSGEIISVSAPGKVIMFGEHAVVYGKKALAASLDLKCRLKIMKSFNKNIKITLTDLKLTHEWPVSDLLSLHISMGSTDENVKNLKVDDVLLDKLKEMLNFEDYKQPEHLAILAFLYIYLVMNHKRMLFGFEVTVDSSLPIGAGLGSSAAYSVCLTSGLLYLFGGIKTDLSMNVDLSKCDLDLINDWSFLVEKVIHGTPSGIDNSVATYGGALWFQNKEIKFIDNMPKFRVLLVNTNIPRSTRQLVEGVRGKVEKYPTILNPVLNAMDSICQKCHEHLNEFYKLQQIVDRQQQPQQLRPDFQQSQQQDSHKEPLHQQQQHQCWQQSQQQQYSQQQQKQQRTENSNNENNNNINDNNINNDGNDDNSNIKHITDNDDNQLSYEKLKNLYSIFNDLIDMNQTLLTFLGVNHPSIDLVLRVFEKFNVHGKLTGAGGGGCVFALLTPDFPVESVQKMAEELHCLDCQCFESSLGGSGVKITIESI